MRWVLAGYCGLALIYITAAQDSNIAISQMPRFYGLKPGRNAIIFCLPRPVRGIDSVRWFKESEYDDEKPKEVTEDQRTEISKLNETFQLFLRHVEVEDSGVYFCEIGPNRGPGTHLQVSRISNLTNAQYRTNMKDALIVVQGLLLATCVAAIMMRKRTMLEKRDSIYEEPDTDHIYEGLAIETCEGGLYEELSVYAQAEGAEAPWERD